MNPSNPTPPVNSTHLPQTPQILIPPAPIVVQSGHKSKLRYLILLIILLSLLSFTVLFFVIKIYFPDTLSRLLRSNNSPAAKVVNNTTIELPVSLTEAGIADVSILYEFQGKIAEVKKEGDSVKLILDKKAPGGPESFLLHPTTRLFFSTDNRNTFKPAEWHDFKIGEEVRFGADYIIKSTNWKSGKNEWRLIYIHILKSPEFFEGSVNQQPQPS